MNQSRRFFLASGLSAGAVTLLGEKIAPMALAAQRWRSESRVAIPPLLSGKRNNGRTIYDLTASHGTTEFFENFNTPTIGINGSFLGPTLKFDAGDDVVLKVANSLRYDTTLHWHGLHVPAKADGGPHQVIKPGSMWRPSFRVKQRGALFWYHSHLMGYTGRQVNDGLAGMILVEDEEAKSLNLPSEYGVDDVPLVIQDRLFNRDGSFAYLTSMHDEMMGFKGNTILVNGTVYPYFEARRSLTRLRLLNGSNSRIYNLGLSNGRPFTQIASDGSLLAHPVRRRRLRLGPGERAEILVELSPNSKTVLTNYPDIVSGGGGMMGMGRMMGAMAGNTETFPVIELRAGRLEKSDITVPKALTDVPNWQPGDASRTRRFTLNMPMMGMMGHRGMMGGGMMGHGGVMGINGKAMDIARIDEDVPLGATEVWAISNATPVSHPFHIHDIQFRVLDRNGRPPSAFELGLKDTVMVDPGETVRVITQFTDYADAERPYMYHCHILEHEDAGMMGQFRVLA